MSLSMKKHVLPRLALIACLAALALAACSKPAANAPATTEPKGETSGSRSGAVPEKLDAAALKAAGVQLADVTAAPVQGQIRVPAEVLENTYGTTLITPRVASLVIRRHARLGDEVRAGTPLVTLSSVEVADAQAGLTMAEQSWRRIQGLGRDLVSGRRYDEAQVAVEQARAKARAYGLPGTAVGRSNGEFTLTAPHAGRLTQDDFVVGQQIEPGHTLFRLVDERKVWIDAKLPAQTAQRIALGSTAQILIGDTRLPGTVTQRGHRSAEDTRTSLARIEVDNAVDRLHAGDLVEAQLTLEGASTSQVTVPTAALTLLQGQTVAFRQETSGALEPVPVETGETIGDATVVTAGLKPGDRIAISGVYALKSRLLRSQLGDSD